MADHIATVEEYIAQFPPDITEKLNKLREIIKSSVPEAREKISYGMPTYFLDKNFFHFAAFKKFIAIYPAPRNEKSFIDILKDFPGSKSGLHFDLKKNLPVDLIRCIVLFNAGKVQANGK